MTERAPHILIVLVHRHNAEYFVPLASALERRGARVSFLSTDYSVEMAAWQRGRRAPNVMHTRLPRTSAAAPVASVSVEDVVAFALRHPTITPDRERLFEQASRILRAYAAHFDRLRPDLVIGWNGTTPQARAAMKLAESRGIATVYFEQGNFPDTIIADPKGVNWEGSMRGVDVPREYDRARIERWLEWFRSRPPAAERPPRARAAVAGRAIADAIVNFFARRSPFHPTLYFDHDKLVFPRRFAARVRRWARARTARCRSVRAETLETPERFVFLPLQVHDDTQVIVHSPAIRTMEELVDAVARAMPEGWHLVVKAHPADEGRRDYAAIEEMLEGPRFHFFRRADTPELIRRAAAVVTLNSSVGLEALAFMKPVVVLGQAVYAGRGITVDASDPGELPRRLAEALRMKVDEDAVKRFLDCFVFEYSRPGDFRRPTPADLDAMAAHVLAQLPWEQRKRVHKSTSPQVRKSTSPEAAGLSDFRTFGLVSAPAPLVSVIMPAWNVARFIGRAIESVLAQTHANWELLIVDDGSTDGTGDVARGFADPRIRVFRTENRGPSAARNRAIAEAKGEFVAFLDADDAWMPGKLEAQLRAFERHGDVALVYTNVVRVTEDGRHLPLRRYPLSRLPVGRCLDRVLVRNEVIGGGTTVMVRRATIMRAGGFPEDLRSSEDWHVWVRCALEGKFEYLATPLAAYRMRASSSSTDDALTSEQHARMIERTFSDPAVRSRLGVSRTRRLRRRAEAVLLYDRGWRALRAGDLAEAARRLRHSIRTSCYDLRQFAMLAAALALRLPFVSRAAVLRLVRK